MKAEVLMSCRKTWCVVLTSLSVLAWLTPGLAQTRNRMDLRNNWLLQSSCKANTPAEVLSTAQFSPDQWYKTTVPSTVLAAQVANGEFKDIYFGDNLRKLPGMGYPIGELYCSVRSQAAPVFLRKREKLWLSRLEVVRAIRKPSRLRAKTTFHT